MVIYSKKERCPKRSETNLTLGGLGLRGETAQGAQPGKEALCLTEGHFDVFRNLHHIMEDVRQGSEAMSARTLYENAPWEMENNQGSLRFVRVGVWSANQNLCGDFQPALLRSSSNQMREIIFPLPS